MAAMHVDWPDWIGDGSLEGEVAGTLWSRLSKGLQKDHNGWIQVSSLLRGTKRAKLKVHLVMLRADLC